MLLQTKILEEYASISEKKEGELVSPNFLTKTRRVAINDSKARAADASAVLQSKRRPCILGPALERAFFSCSEKKRSYFFEIPFLTLRI